MNTIKRNQRSVFTTMFERKSNQFAAFALGTALLSGANSESQLSQSIDSFANQRNSTSTEKPTKDHFRQQASQEAIGRLAGTSPDFAHSQNDRTISLKTSVLSTDLLGGVLAAGAGGLHDLPKSGTGLLPPDFETAISAEFWRGRLENPYHKRFLPAAEGERSAAAGRVVQSHLNNLTLVAWNPQETGTAKDPTLVEIRKEVNKAVCEYWLEKDKNEPGGGNQDAEEERSKNLSLIPDRLSNKSYNGHGVHKAYPHPIPGARADGHFNCEYFALYFRDAFVASFGDRGGECWILHHSGHATAAWLYKGQFVIIEPQGGSPYFVKFPELVPANLPARGEVKNVGGVTVYNRRHCNWLKIDEQDARAK